MPNDAFRYSTFFSFKRDAPDGVREEFARRWAEFMMACPEPQTPELNVPLVSESRWPRQSHDFFSTMVFKDQAACDAYLNHPLHLAVHHELVLPYADMEGVFGGKYRYRPIRR